MRNFTSFVMGVALVLACVFLTIVNSTEFKGIPSDKEIAEAYVVDRCGEGNYDEIELIKCDDEYISLAAYEDGEQIINVSINRDCYVKYAE